MNVSTEFPALSLVGAIWRLLEAVPRVTSGTMSAVSVDSHVQLGVWERDKGATPPRVPRPSLGSLLTLPLSE